MPSKDKEPEPEDDSAEAVAARKKTVEDEKKKKKTAPDTKKMLSLLYDEVEAGNVTKIGVDPSLDWCVLLTACLSRCPSPADPLWRSGGFC